MNPAVRGYPVPGGSSAGGPGPVRDEKAVPQPQIRAAVPTQGGQP